MSSVEFYIDKLKSENDLIKYLIDESCLPGPRANLELLAATTLIRDDKFFNSLLSFDKGIEINNSPLGFLVMCGIAGIGRNLTKERIQGWETMKKFASHPSWRIRESVAMGLQFYGDTNVESLIEEMEKWSCGNLLEKRAAVAALCEPRLLNNPSLALKILNILNKVTESIMNYPNSKDDDFVVLKKALGFCWSVAITKHPGEGKKLFEKLFTVNDKNIKWIIKENLKKNRLIKMDKIWTENCLLRV